MRLHRQWEEAAALAAAKRRRARVRAGAFLALLAVGAVVFLVATEGFDLLGGDGAVPAERSAAPAPVAAAIPASVRPPPPAAYPPRDGIAEARDFARSRQGPVSFAVIDSEGELHGELGDRRYVSASVVKAMLLIAEIDRLEAEGLPLDPTTRTLLEQMITYSDNDAADTVYYRVGDEGLFEVARHAGLERFTVAGHWGNAQLTANDMAVLMSKLDELLAGPHAEFASAALEGVVTEQRWGIPAARRRRRLAPALQGRMAHDRAGPARPPGRPAGPRRERGLGRRAQRRRPFDGLRDRDGPRDRRPPGQPSSGGREPASRFERSMGMVIRSSSYAP